MIDVLSAVLLGEEIKEEMLESRPFLQPRNKSRIRAIAPGAMK